MSAKYSFSTLLSAAFITAMTLIYLQSTQAEAAVLKNVSEYAGKRCSTPPKGSGAIVGLFLGVDEQSFLTEESNVTIHRYRCFDTMRECQGWLYTMNSKYFATNPNLTSRCFIR